MKKLKMFLFILMGCAGIGYFAYGQSLSKQHATLTIVNNTNMSGVISIAGGMCTHTLSTSQPYQWVPPAICRLPDTLSVYVGSNGGNGPACYNAGVNFAKNRLLIISGPDEAGNFHCTVTPD